MLPKPTVLDNPNSIREVDKSNMLSFCSEASKHYEKAAQLGKTASVNYPAPKAIIVAGMGGSAMGGELLKDWTRDRIAVPVEICREYSLPAYADRRTLVFVTSYSGETEESLSAFLDAIRRRCMIVCISSGGRLREFAEKLHVPHICVPSGMAPRATLPYLFMPLPLILEKIGLVSSLNPEVSETIEVLRLVSAANSSGRPLNSNLSKTLASAINGTVPTVYGFGTYRAVAQRLKTQFNENSKVPAKWEFFPELDHNEIVGWEGAKNLAKLFSVIFIRDQDETIGMRIRIETTKELMHRKSLGIFEVRSTGKSQMAKMCSVICVGDFASVYLAVLRGVDPTPVKTIGALKKKLETSGLKERTVRELKKLAEK